MFTIREPIAAGRFYPSNPTELDRQLDGLIGDAPNAAPALALVSPHAGYVYSGAVAGAGFARVVVPSTAIVLCPNHTGRGERRSIWPSGSWRIPGGLVPVDAELAEELAEQAGLAPDRGAHLGEHAIEVQLPFLKRRNPQVRIVPIALGHLRAIECMALGERIGEAMKRRPGQVLVVASTDFSHYIRAEEARRLDGLAIERIEACDPEGLYTTVDQRHISMCGFIPTAVALAAARFLGARSANLVRYGNSGETSGDFEEVVGYASLTVPMPGGA